MRALVITAPHRATVTSSPPPELRPGWALVQPALVGICGTDIHIFTGELPMANYPVVPGHEFVGELVELAPPADGPWPAGRRPPERLTPGLRVTADPAVPCGRCHPCRAGHYNVCVRQQVLGVHIPGAAAELVAVRIDCLLIVPDGVDDQTAALAEPLSIALNVCHRAKVGPGEWVAIIGAGTIGLACLLHARSRGSHCAVVEPVQWRRELAVELGAEVAVSPEEAAEGLGSWGLDGRASVVLEASGSAAGTRVALLLAAPAGRVATVGFWAYDVPLPATEITRKQLTVVGSRLHGATMAQTLAMLAAGMLDPRPLIGAVAPLSRGPKLLAAAARGEAGGVKTLLRITA